MHLVFKEFVMETILCPTDFSPSSENAIRYANKLAQHMSSRILLFHTIYEPVGTELVSDTGLPYPEPRIEADYRRKKQEKLNYLKKDLEKATIGLPVTYKTRIEYGLFKNTIPQLAKELPADLVVLGYKGVGGLKETYLGSATSDIIKDAPCPVLLIPRQIPFKPLRKIVFATKFQGEPFRDVQFVLKLAGLFDAEILFLHVLTKPSVENEVVAEDELERLKKRLPYPHATFYTEVNPHIEEGISQFCRRHHADLLVMGYHPRSFWQDLFSQDYTQEMAYHTYLPLLVIHNLN